MHDSNNRSVVEGTWEEVASFAKEFAGRRFRVSIIPEPIPIVPGNHLSAAEAYRTPPRIPEMPKRDHTLTSLYD